MFAIDLFIICSWWLSIDVLDCDHCWDNGIFLIPIGKPCSCTICAICFWEWFPCTTSGSFSKVSDTVLIIYCFRCLFDVCTRTIALVHYSNARIVFNEFKLLRDSQLLISILLAAFNIFFFWPKEQWDNGNTWFFAVPMFLATMVDTYYLDEHVVNNYVLVMALFSAHLIAFFFTLAFRKIVPLGYVYLSSIICVLGMFIAIVPRIIQQNLVVWTSLSYLAWLTILPTWLLFNTTDEIVGKMWSS